MLPSQMKKVVKENFATKFYKPGDRVCFRNYSGGKSFWEDRISTKRLGRGIYMLKGRRFKCKKHLNQMRPRYIKDAMLKDREELPMEVIYDTFKIPVPISPPKIDVSVPNSTSAKSTSSPKITDTTNHTSTKSDQTEKYQEEKSNNYVSTPKRRGIELTFQGKISLGEVL